MFFGVVTQNDCCERILEVPEVDVPIVSTVVRGEESVSSFILRFPFTITLVKGVCENERFFP